MTLKIMYYISFILFYLHQNIILCKIRFIYIYNKICLKDRLARIVIVLPSYFFDIMAHWFVSFRSRQMYSNSRSKPRNMLESRNGKLVFPRIVIISSLQVLTMQQYKKNAPDKYSQTSFFVKNSLNSQNDAFDSIPNKVWVISSMFLWMSFIAFGLLWCLDLH